MVRIFHRSARMIRSATYTTVNLDEDRWHTCYQCGGTGRIFDEGDLHRSPGVIPCQNFNCFGGIVKRATIMTQKPVYRVKAGRGE